MKKGKTKTIFLPLLFFVVVGPGSGINKNQDSG
jgi:hypothetical protein